MSDVPQDIPLERPFAGKWQIPLLLIALGLLLAGLWQIRPQSDVPTFEDFFAHAVDLKSDELYPEASDYISSLLAEPETTVDQKQRLHGLMAEVIYGYESGNAVHGQSNAERIIGHSDASLAGVKASDGATLLMRAEAWQWQGRADRALTCYSRALAAGIENPWTVRRRIIEIQRQKGQVSPEKLHAEFDAFLAADDIDEPLWFWAVEQKMSLLLEQGKYAEADHLLANHADRFVLEPAHRQFTYLQSLVRFHLGQAEQAELELRALRDQLLPGDPLYAQTGWLLGKIYQGYEAPEPALSFFDDVVSKCTPGPYRLLSVLGQAETLAKLERFEASLKAFSRVIQTATASTYGSQIDLQLVRQSLTQLYEALRTSGRLPEAMAYLRLAMPLTPPGDDRIQAIYTERLADLAFALGEHYLDVARGREETGADDMKQSAREAFIESADQYLHLAKLKQPNHEAAMLAFWRAADALDLAGERLRRAQVLEDFIAQWPDNDRVSEALLRLGQTYQSVKQWDKAILAYRRNLAEHPRAYWSGVCLIRLADCLFEAGRLREAEQTLLRIVEHVPEDEIAPVWPVSQEYKDALFKLGDLYVQLGMMNQQADAFEKAIARYEEAIQRYPEDQRCDRAMYVLADAYRRSAAKIREDLADPKQIAFKDELTVAHQDRLLRAEKLFQQVIDRYAGRPTSSLGELDRLYVKLSYFYLADVVYDTSYLSDPSDVRPYVRALEKYTDAAWVYQDDPMAMSAYIQIISCHLRLGNHFQARKTLQRAIWALGNIADKSFQVLPPQQRRAFWKEYLSWLSDTPTFKPDQNSGDG